MQNKIKQTTILSIDFKSKKLVKKYVFDYEHEQASIFDYNGADVDYVTFEEYQKRYDRKHGKAS